MSFIKFSQTQKLTKLLLKKETGVFLSGNKGCSLQQHFKNPAASPSRNKMIWKTNCKHICWDYFFFSVESLKTVLSEV